MFRKIGILTAILVVTLLSSLLITAPARAADMRSGDSVNVSSGEVVDDDLYLAGQDIVMNGAVNGDLVAAGNSVTISGKVNGSVTVVGQSVVILGEVGNSVRAAGSSVTINGRVNGDLVAFGNVVKTTPESNVGRDLFIGSGELIVNGPLGRNLKGSAAKLSINSSIGGDVDIEVGEVMLQPAADVKGSFKYKSQQEAIKEPGSSVAGETKHLVPEKKDPAFSCLPQPDTGRGQTPGEKAAATTVGGLIGAATAAFFAFVLVLVLIGIVIRYAMAFVTGIVLILVLNRYIPGLLEAVKSKPWPCLGYGALKFFITPLFAFLLLVTIVGIPIGLAAVALYVLAVYLAPILFSVFLGKWMLQQPAEVTATGPLIGALALGLLVLHACMLLPVIGAMAWLAAVLFGLGTVMLYARGKWLK